MHFPPIQHSSWGELLAQLCPQTRVIHRLWRAKHFSSTPRPRRVEREAVSPLSRTLSGSNLCPIFRIHSTQLFPYSTHKSATIYCTPSAYTLFTHRALGARVRELRLRAGMSRETFSTEAAIRATNLARIESGESSPGLDVLTRLAGALQTTVADLVRDVPSVE